MDINAPAKLDVSTREAEARDGTGQRKHVDAPTAHFFDPLTDYRWDTFLESHPRASVFHTRAWLQALRRTYGYQPAACTTSPPESDLNNVIVYCRVESWLTGRRFVSLPFSDHCEMLVNGQAGAQSLLSALEQELIRHRCRYIELRPVTLAPASPLIRVSEEYCLHELDLKPDIETIFENFHKSSTTRKIHRAQRERLIYQEGRSEFLLEHFYRLFAHTRKRHGIPPQPQEWFKNLIESFGESLKIRMVFQDSRPVASILTLCYKDTMTYKYGCSDPRYNTLGGIHLLFWRSICEAKEQGLQSFDLGRSDTDNHGLITFKDRWGAARSTLTYFRYFAPGCVDSSSGREKSIWKSRATKALFTHMPNIVLRAAGRIFYKHVA
jgi:hypothetical protein